MVFAPSSIAPRILFNKPRHRWFLCYLFPEMEKLVVQKVPDKSCDYDISPFAAWQSNGYLFIYLAFRTFIEPIQLTKRHISHNSSMVKSLPIHDLEGRDDQAPLHSKESNSDTTTIPRIGRGRILLSMDLDGVEYHAAVALPTSYLVCTMSYLLHKRDGDSLHR